MAIDLPSSVSKAAFSEFLLALADDELILGHRDSEWTGYAPILEEDIAFSNIAQDELGHSLVWFGLYEQNGGGNPDAMAFERNWQDFRCCRFVSYPKGDFAYTVIRQYLFDAAEQVRLRALEESSVTPLREVAGRIIREENYHLLHSQGLVERLGDATDESHSRMQAALDIAFPQALGMFEKLKFEDELVRAKVFPGNDNLCSAWLKQVVPVLRTSSLSVPVNGNDGAYLPSTRPDDGGRSGNHSEHLKQLVEEMQSVYRLAPGGKW
jgi:ring-1,2-phenylacetyl-CoA epoxidase subunit PaaC